MSTLREALAQELDSIRDGGLYKEERVIVTPQGPRIRVRDAAEVLNFCANNYLGLSSHPALIAAAHKALDDHGYGLSSVRFICGTQDIHKELEGRLAAFLHQGDAILYTSCFDANGGLFETLLGEEDAIVSDELNHASIIDGIRLAKAQRFRYKHADMNDLEAQLKAAAGARRRLIATDGVFSMDGDMAPLLDVVGLAARYDALVMVDDSHATGFLGPTGRGSGEACGVMDKIDVVTSTLGKALGGASGGFTAAARELIEFLRQRSRPYLFSNTLAPPIVAGSIAALDLIEGSTELRDRLLQNAQRFRGAMAELGFNLRPGSTPIVPVLLGEARLAQEMAHDLLALGIYVIGFSFPVVPKGAARIRVQLSAAHTPEHVERAIEAFATVGRKHGVIA
jgi:glycine C-acetyltransferase